MLKVLTTAFLLLFSVNAYSQAYLNFPIDTLVKDGYFNYRSMIKHDANGKLHLVNTRQLDTDSQTRDIFYRNNVSGSFVTTRVTNNAVDDNYASFGFDQQGFVHIGWERRDASNNFQLIYANNRNGNFNDTVWITSGGLNKATPFMAVGRDSLVHFVYYTFAAGQDNAYYRSYNYVTGTLGPETVLGPAETGSENDIEVAIDSNNKFHIVYATNSSINGGALKYFTNESGPLTEILTGVTANGEYPDIHIANDNTIHIVYRFATDKRIYDLKRTAGLGGFFAPVAVTPAGLGNPAYWRAVDTDDNGRLYVTYQNSVNPAPRGFFLVHGTGSSFSAPILVFEDSTGSYIGRGSSSVAARGNGEIAVAFDPTAVRNGDVVSDIMLKRGVLTITGIEPGNETVSGYQLMQNYPNPFNPVTNFGFRIADLGFVTLKVYDINGKVIETLISRNMNAGTYEISFDGSKLPSGVYFYKLEAGSFSDTKKFILAK